jgi:hypothetical protein
VTYSNELDRLLAYVGFAGFVRHMSSPPLNGVSSQNALEMINKRCAALETELAQIQRRANEEKSK